MSRPSAELRDQAWTLDAVLEQLAEIRPDVPPWVRPSVTLAIEDVRVARRRIRNLASVVQAEEHQP